MNNKFECTVVSASSFPEFFYKDSDILVSEGQPIGVEIDRISYVEFLLFDDIYWNPQFENDT